MTLLARSQALLVVTVFAVLASGCAPEKSKNSVLDTEFSSSIIGGSEVAEGAALQKSIVGIYDLKRNSLCTGSLLENNIVLTAAHCIGSNAQDHMIIFTADLEKLFNSNDKNLLLQKVRRAVKTVLNPNWGKKHANPTDAWGDTALIKFAGDVPAGFAPATLLASNDILTEGAKVTVAGYGVSNDVLTEVKRSDYPDFKERELRGEVFCETSEDGKSEKCYKEEMSGEGRLRTTELTVAGNFNETEIAFDQRHGQASCEGDSGGPAYVKQANGEYHLFGVTSRGTRGCNGFVIYSQVTSAPLAAWLKEAKVQVSR